MASELCPAEAGDFLGELGGLGAVEEAVAVDGFCKVDGGGEEEAEALVVGGWEMVVWKWVFRRRQVRTEGTSRWRRVFWRREGGRGGERGL